MDSHPPSYTLHIVYEEPEIGNRLKVIASNNEEASPLSIVVTIQRSQARRGVHSGFRASAEFFEANNRIDDIATIVKNERFLGLIEYYQEEIFALSFKKNSLLNDIKNAQGAKSTIKHNANFASNFVRKINLGKSIKLDGKLTSDLLLALQSIFQGLNVYTSCKRCKDTEIIIASTNIDISADMTTYINSSLLHSKLTIRLVYIHLGNVILATQLISKQISDATTRIEKMISSTRRGALPFGVAIGAIHSFIAYYLALQTQISSFSIENLFSIFVVPMIWPITAFCVRVYAPRIISHVLRYAINRILRP
jgi:hypothetical protein